ncbi:hypothetical protein DRO50_01715 [Candidatus Bathyarchaeota archaeon]|nr:MAG: hypothetical protein DRO50_01715 [Candidatus Bathyarchaeota archaeon]
MHPLFIHVIPLLPVVLAILGSLIPIIVLGLKRPSFVSALICVVNAAVEGAVAAAWIEGLSLDSLAVGGSFGALWATVFCLAIFGLPAVMKNQKFIWLLFGTVLGMNIGGLLGLAFLDVKRQLFLMVLGSFLGVILGGISTLKRKKRLEAA